MYGVGPVFFAAAMVLQRHPCSPGVAFLPAALFDVKVPLPPADLLRPVRSHNNRAGRQQPVISAHYGKTT